MQQSRTRWNRVSVSCRNKAFSGPSVRSWWQQWELQGLTAWINMYSLVAGQGLCSCTKVTGSLARHLSRQNQPLIVSHTKSSPISAGGVAREGASHVFPAMFGQWNDRVTSMMISMMGMTCMLACVIPIWRLTSTLFKKYVYSHMQLFVSLPDGWFHFLSLPSLRLDWSVLKPQTKHSRGVFQNARESLPFGLWKQWLLQTSCWFVAAELSAVMHRTWQPFPLSVSIRPDLSLSRTVAQSFTTCCPNRILAEIDALKVSG